MTYRVDLALLACACVAYAWLIVVVLFGRTH